jgi:CubicO group peptidase (beta-lactamase class C family)
MIDLMQRALGVGLFTCAALVITGPEGLLYEGYFGEASGRPTNRDTLFDLASLTKVVGTTPLWMRLAARSPGILDKSIAAWFSECPRDKTTITPRLLLRHSSGLPHWRPYYLLRNGALPRKEFTLRAILSERLQYKPGCGTLYSDLGFMLSAFIAERETGAPFDVAIKNEVINPLGLERDLMFTPCGEPVRGLRIHPFDDDGIPDSAGAGEHACDPLSAPPNMKTRRSIASTSPDDPPGLVHDYNARALGGVSGHAGLFGTALGVAATARETLAGLSGHSKLFAARLVREFTQRADNDPPGARVLGFETPAPDGSSSCGRRFSPRSFGHTGFTGTSLWIDPDAGLAVVLLTNRVRMGQGDMRIKEFRPKLHDAARRYAQSAGWTG